MLANCQLIKCVRSAQMICLKMAHHHDDRNGKGNKNKHAHSKWYRYSNGKAAAVHWQSDAIYTPSNCITICTSTWFIFQVVFCIICLFVRLFSYVLFICCYFYFFLFMCYACTLNSKPISKSKQQHKLLTQSNFFASNFFFRCCHAFSSHFSFQSHNFDVSFVCSTKNQNTKKSPTESIESFFSPSLYEYI